MQRSAMNDGADGQKRFLFLQGPHGPFFQALGTALVREGHEVLRVGFNRGDRVFWSDKARFHPYLGSDEGWADALSELIDAHQSTDIVLYGTTRPVHARAIEVAKANDLTVHVFEEGYIRPRWITYERGGSNGESRLCDIAISDMRCALASLDSDPKPADRWGDMAAHRFYGALYHAAVLTGRTGGVSTHRDISVGKEAWLALRRFLLTPFLSAERIIATRRVTRGRFPYHVVLLQLAHDANFQHFSPFEEVKSFLNEVLSGFAAGAPADAHIVFKEHPLEDDRAETRRLVRRLAARHKVNARVHYVSGGKLAHLLDGARSALTVNSTAAQQALWRGLPLKAYGASVYDKGAFVSAQSTQEFFADPTPPDQEAYAIFRAFLLATSQIPGSYYTASGRRALVLSLLAPLLADHDPYDRIMKGGAAQQQQSNYA